MSANVTAKARRTLPKLSKELASAVTAGGSRPATALVPVGRSQDPNQLHTSSSSYDDAGTLKLDQITAVVREAGFAPQVAATLAAVCAYAPLQEAFWESIQVNFERDGLSLAEGVMASITKGKEREALRNQVDECDSVPTRLCDYDHYKLKTHSFNEYRSEQDIASFLQVEEDLGSVSYADDWRETSIGARADLRSREDGRDGGGGHAGEPGDVDEDSRMFGVVLFLAVTALSLSFLYVGGNHEVYRTALKSEIVKAAVALSEVCATSLLAGRW